MATAHLHRFRTPDNEKANTLFIRALYLETLVTAPNVVAKKADTLKFMAKTTKLEDDKREVLANRSFIKHEHQLGLKQPSDRFLCGKRVFNVVFNSRQSLAIFVA